MSLILNIDTSMQEGSASLAREGSVLQHLTNSLQKDHVAFLHVAVKDILTRAALPVAALDAIAVTAGPGSYTGLRVGFAAAKGLSYALGKPLISISSTEAMAEAVRPQSGAMKPDYYCPMIDARRDEVYTAVYDSELKEITAPHAMIVTESSFVELPAAATIVCFGSGAEKWKKISSLPNVFFTDVVDIFPALARLSFQRFSEKNFADPVFSVPLYGKEFYTGG